MGTSKILIDGVGIDLTQDTVAANKMLSGTKAHDSSGDSITGGILTYTGTQASGTKSITANGTYDVTQFASATVNVPPVGETNVKTISVTVAAVQTEDFLFASGVQEIIDHFSDPNLLVEIFHGDNVSIDTTYTMLFTMASNSMIFKTYCGMTAHFASSGTSSSMLEDALNSVSTKVNAVYVTPQGDVRVVSGTYRVRPGTYKMRISW